jgi:threonylcarbamoyladenosine tRNA methylthiotransferase MtaB
LKTFYLQTFGCKLNQADTAAIRAALKARGLLEVRDPATADLVVVNTCSVTARADSDARAAIRRLKRLSPGSRLFVTGCYAEHSAQLLAAMPEVDEVFGLTQRQELYRVAGGTAGYSTDGLPQPFEPELDFGGKTRAFLKVQEGCDQNCSYCIVRLVRNGSRSLKSAEVIRRLHKLAAQGFNEVVLTATHLGHWGKDTGEGGLPDLLQLIETQEGLPRIRLCSLEPFDELDEVLQIMARSRRLAQHLHIAVQSGSARILEAMRRTPDPSAIRLTAERARELMPLCGIGADIIVGFPGETDEDFQATLELMTTAPFTYAHVFAFSPRPGTDAAKLPQKVDARTIKVRSSVLRTRMADKNLQFRRSLEGKKIKALALARRDSQGRSTVLTDNYIQVTIEGGTQPHPNQPCEIEITRAEMKQTFGRLLE